MSVPHPWPAGFGISAVLLALGATSGLAPMSAGCCGPAGASALFYALAQDLTGLNGLWPVVSLAAAASVVAHGVTGTHLSALLGARPGRQAA